MSRYLTESEKRIARQVARELRDDKPSAEDVVTSAAIAAVTGSAIIGGVLGGSILGAVAGDLFDGDLFD